MIRTHKTFTFWSNQVRPNPFPAQTFPNLSLGKTAISMAIYVPMYAGRENVNFVHKNISPSHVGGEASDYDVLKPTFSDMTGSGLTNDELALLHPIKVFTACFIKYFTRNILLFHIGFPDRVTWASSSLIKTA